MFILRSKRISKAEKNELIKVLKRNPVLIAECDMTIDQIKQYPITDVLEELTEAGAYEQEVNGKTEFLSGISYCISVIKKYM